MRDGSWTGAILGRLNLVVRASQMVKLVRRRLLLLLMTPALPRPFTHLTPAIATDTIKSNQSSSLRNSLENAGQAGRAPPKIARTCRSPAAAHAQPRWPPRLRAARVRRVRVCVLQATVARTYRATRTHTSSASRMRRWARVPAARAHLYIAAPPVERRYQPLEILKIP
ncbi:unnamed protein product [Chrysodeixis includens]|uniref:Uncharacterized protein n=1 Tax=Chrysodeixis includens TaxID=689277 RepID=A0A9N8KYA0_CHRIL|nr:unnamed protein product [Chrysodeixis includens]